MTGHADAAAPQPIVVIPGDGVGPELTAAATRVMDATGVALDWRTAHLGVPAVEAGGAPVPDATVDAIVRAGVALKGPVATPADGSMASPNVELRRRLGLTFQVRHVRPFGVPDVALDVDVVRETTEDLYAGIGFAAASDAARDLRDACARFGVTLPADAGLSLKFLSASSCRAVWEFAEAAARRAGRTRLTAAHKAAVMPDTDGMFVRIGREVVEPTGLGFEAVAVDTLAARIVRAPRSLEMIVAPNQYGDILADVAGAVAGGVGVIAGANHGPSSGPAVFEAAHGAVWRHAGRDTANPVGLILSGALALRHMGHPAAADTIVHAVRTVGDAVVRAGSRPPTTAVTAAVVDAVRGARRGAATP